MAGWLIVWRTDPGTPLKLERWKAAVAAAGRYGEPVTECVGDDVALAAWRRTTGEFAHSGICLTPAPDCRLAWVGQCLGDSGDSTREAIRLLAERSVPTQAVAALNGPFAAAVVHENPRTISLWTDRYRHYPIYTCQNGNIRAASTELRCLIPWLTAPRLDLSAIDLLLRSGELIDDQTLLEGIRMLPAATHASDSADYWQEKRYWRLAFCPDHHRSSEQWTAELAERLRTALARIQAACPRIGVPLSGGLDSRLCLGLCEHPARVPSFTWGLPGCRDIRCASAFAAAVGSTHRVHFWDPPAFVPLWPEGVDRTGGSFGVHEMYVLPFARLLAGHCDVVLNGLAGDALLGGNFLKWSWFGRSAATLGELTWRWRVSRTQDDWTDRLMRVSPGPAFSCRRWVASLQQRPDGRPIERLNAWLLENRVARYTNCGTFLLRAGVESHAPFYDRDVMDALLAVPLEYKIKHRLYLKVLRRACPTAARVPWQRTGIPPAWGFGPNLTAMALQRVVRKAGKWLGIDPFPAAAVADNAGWLRREWRTAVQGILLSPRTLDRGWLNPDAVRALWETHQQGMDLTRTLGILVGIELFVRQVEDQAGFERGEKAALPASRASSSMTGERADPQAAPRPVTDAGAAWTR